MFVHIFYHFKLFFIYVSIHCLSCNWLSNLFISFRQLSHKEKQHTLIEIQNIISNVVILCLNCLYFIYNRQSDSILCLQIFCTQMLYELFSYYVILDRKNKLVFYHHCYSYLIAIYGLYSNAYFKVATYATFIETTNIFLSLLLITKRFKSKLQIVFYISLIISYIIFRIIFIPYLVCNLHHIIPHTELLYYQLLLLFTTLWFMSIFWFKKILYMKQ